MALKPFKRQRLSFAFGWHNTTLREVAEKIGIPEQRLRMISYGRCYPSPEEIAGISDAFDGLPIETLLDAELLKYRNGPWPPLQGKVAARFDREREADR